MLRYRRANKDDITAIVALVESAYRGETSRQGWTTEADFLDGQRTDVEEVSELLQKEGSIILLCENDNELLASIHIKHQDNSAYFGMFAVQPEKQGQSVGGALLQQAEQLASELWQVSLCRMLVINLRQELISWYQRRGYQTTGVQQPFPYGQPRFGLPKRDDLVLDLLEKTIEHKI